MSLVFLSRSTDTASSTQEVEVLYSYRRKKRVPFELKTAPCADKIIVHDAEGCISIRLQPWCGSMFITITRTEAKNIKSDDPLSSSLYVISLRVEQFICDQKREGVWGVDHTYYLPVSKHRSSSMLGAVSVRTLVNNLKDSQALHLFL
jgi:hypothetical protein